MFTIDTEITCYLLPQDGPAAYATFLKNLTDPGATWIVAYAFSLPDMVHDLLVAHQRGVPHSSHRDLGKCEIVSELNWMILHQRPTPPRV